MNDITGLMLKSRLFNDFSPSECDAIISLLKPVYKIYYKGETIIKENDKVDYVGIIETGMVSCEKTNYENQSHRLYALEPYNTIGLEIAATTTQSSPLSFICIEECGIVFFSYNRLVMDASLPTKTLSKIMNNMMTYLANENMRRMYKIDLLREKSLRKRLLMYLLHEADKRGAATFMIKFNRDELAMYLNVNRSAMSNELSLMQRDGIISFSKNKFTIHNINTLVERSM